MSKLAEMFKEVNTGRNKRNNTRRKIREVKRNRNTNRNVREGKINEGIKVDVYVDESSIKRTVNDTVKKIENIYNKLGSKLGNRQDLEFNKSFVGLQGKGEKIFSLDGWVERDRDTIDIQMGWIRSRDNIEGGYFYFNGKENRTLSKQLKPYLESAVTKNTEDNQIDIEILVKFFENNGETIINEIIQEYGD